MEIMLATTFEIKSEVIDGEVKLYSGMDATGYWISEKLDGVRAYWNAKRKLIFSRNGNRYSVPEWFIKDFPDEDLDGELWSDRGQFNKISGTLRKIVPNEDEWKIIVFKVFDVPNHNAVYEDRVKLIENFSKKSKYIKPVEIFKCENNDHLFSELIRFQKLGAEGLMLRKPGSKYERKRSKNLLKVKTFTDSEAKVLNHITGKGRLADLTGSIEVKCIADVKHGSLNMLKGTVFSIGTGFTDVQRKNPPPIGSIVTFRFQELTDSVNPKPRFPVFIGARDYE